MALISSCMNCQLPKLARGDRSGIFFCILPLAFRRPGASVQAGHCSRSGLSTTTPPPCQLMIMAVGAWKTRNSGVGKPDILHSMARKSKDQTVCFSHLLFFLILLSSWVGLESSRQFLV
ncbi:hypothetical protein BDW75DRAFT_153424 [Aspergillus navahoensis]